MGTLTGINRLARGSQRDMGLIERFGGRKLMRRLFALALAVGIAAASFAVSPAHAVTVPIKGNLGILPVGSTQIFGSSPTSSPFAEAFTFSVGVNSEGKTAAAALSGLPFPNSVVLTSVSIVKGTVTAGGFNIISTLDSGGEGDLVTAALTAGVFAVVVQGTGTGPYSGVLKVVPVPAALPLFLTALAGVGLIARRRANKAQPAIA
jgi:hypothetical protein